MYKEELQKALLGWVNSVESVEAASFSELWDGRLLLALLRRIQNFQPGELELIDEAEPKMVLVNLRKISKALSNHYERHLVSIFNPEFVDLLSIAQTRSTLEIFKLCVQIFGACVQAPNKNYFISLIVRLSSDDQEQLMTLIKSHGFVQTGSNQKRERRPSSDRGLEQNAYSETQALLEQVEKQEVTITLLEEELLKQANIRKELEKKLLASEEECQRLRDEIDSGITHQQFLMPEQIEMEKVEMENESLALVEELKQQMTRQTEKHMQERADLMETIDFLKEKLERKAAENVVAQEEANRDEKGSPSKNIYADHPPCISIAKHYELIGVKTQKITELQKSEFEANHRALVLKSENEQLIRQRNKLQLEASQKSELITRTDYDALKVNILSLLNDRFKVEVSKLKEARS